MKSASPVRLKSKAFALEIIDASEMLNRKHQFIISKQLLKCGTSIGANIVEAQDAQSKADFISKLSISLKEARETSYWLELINDASLLDDASLRPLFLHIKELIALLTAILITSRKNVNSQL